MENVTKILFTGLTGNLGRDLLEFFLVKDYDITTTYLYDSELKLIPEEYIDKIDFYKSDILLEKETNKLLKDFDKNNKKFDSIINLVGGFSFSKIENLKIDDFKKMFEINLYTVFNISKYAKNLLKDSKNKSIINIISPYALNPIEGVSSYAASKAALLSFSKSCAIEYHDVNIRVNCIMTDTLNTEANRKEMPNADFSLWVKPEEVFKSLKFLISENSKFINGDYIKIGKE